MADKDFKVKTGLDLPAPLPILEGGTGQTTANNALNAMLPSQTTHGSKILGTDGTNTTWVNPGAAYQTSAPDNPVTGQLWVDSDETGDSLDPYIIRRKTITATAGQTVFTTDVVFTDGYEQIYYNGVLLVRTTDYTTSGGTNTVTLLQGASAGDTVEIISSTPINLVNNATLNSNTFVSGQIIRPSSGNALEIIASSSVEPLVVTRTGAPSGLLSRNFNGTYESPTAITANQRTSFFASSMYGTTSYQSNAAINIYAAENQTDAARGTYMNFETTPLLSVGRVERMRIDSTGSVGIGASLLSTFNPNSSFNKVLTIQQSDQALTLGSYWEAGVGQNSYINSSQGTSRSNASNLFFQTGGLNRFLIEGNGNVQISNNGVDTLRYFDIYNTNSGNSAGTIIRMITNNAANTAVTTVDLVKYRNGYFGILNNDSAATIGFGTAGTERMRITNTGRVGIGLDAPRGALEVAGNILTVWDNASIGTMFSDGSGYFLGIQTQVSPRFTDIVAKYADNGAIRFISGASIERARFESVNGYMLVGYTSSNGAYRLQVNSQIFATSSSIATSDGKYKENVLPISSGLEIIDSLNPVSFDWKAHHIHNFVEGKTVGFIAQEVKEALKDYEWVNNIIKTNTTEAVLDEDGNEVTPAEEFLGIAESNIIPLLVAAVKELKSDFEEYKRLHP